MIESLIFLAAVIGQPPPTGDAAGSKAAAEAMARAMSAAVKSGDLAKAVELKAKSMGPVKLPEAHKLWAKKETGEKLNPIESHRLNKLFAPTEADGKTARETVEKIKAGEINPARVKAITKGRETMAATKTGFLFSDEKNRDQHAEKAVAFAEWVEDRIPKK